MVFLSGLYTRVVEVMERTSTSTLMDRLSSLIPFDWQELRSSTRSLEISMEGS